MCASGVGSRQCLGDLEAHRPIPGDAHGIVMVVDESETVLLGEFVGTGQRFIKVAGMRQPSAP